MRGRGGRMGVGEDEMELEFSESPSFCALQGVAGGFLAL
jgi:hypothetical protein